MSFRRSEHGLIARFGAERVFMDVQDIQPGQDFEQAIEQTLARCDHMLP